MKRIVRIIPSDTVRKIDFTIIPDITENRTSPSLYSFFNGLKNVLRRRETESNEAIYLLNRTKKFRRPPRTSLYQNNMRYSG